MLGQIMEIKLNYPLNSLGELQLSVQKCFLNAKRVFPSDFIYTPANAQNIYKYYWDKSRTLFYFINNG